MTKDVIAFKTAQKKQQLVESLGFIRNQGVISTEDYKAKCELLNQKTQLIQEMIMNGQED